MRCADTGFKPPADEVMVKAVGLAAGFLISNNELAEMVFSRLIPVTRLFPVDRPVTV